MWVKPEFEIRMVEKMKNTSEVCAAILTSELVSMLSSVFKLQNENMTS